MDLILQIELLTLIIPQQKGGVKLVKLDFPRGSAGGKGDPDLPRRVVAFDDCNRVQALGPSPRTGWGKCTSTYEYWLKKTMVACRCSLKSVHSPNDFMDKRWGWPPWDLDGSLFPKMPELL